MIRWFTSRIHLCNGAQNPRCDACQSVGLAFDHANDDRHWSPCSTDDNWISLSDLYWCHIAVLPNVTVGREGAQLKNWVLWFRLTICQRLFFWRVFEGEMKLRSVVSFCQTSRRDRPLLVALVLPEQPLISFFPVARHWQGHLFPNLMEFPFRPRYEVGAAF